MSSTHSSAAGTATKDFSDSRGLVQLVDFPTRGTAILDLVLYGHQGSIQSFPAFNTSDHLVLLVTVSMSTPDFVISSPPFHRRVYNLTRTNWDRLSHHFSSVTWDMTGSVESIVSRTTAVIVSATHQFVPSCIPKMVRPTPWWNRYCERAWQWKMSCWNNHDDDGFRRATSIATCVYARAFRDYQSHIMNKLRKSPTDRDWWTLTKSCQALPSGNVFLFLLHQV